MSGDDGLDALLDDAACGFYDPVSSENNETNAEKNEKNEKNGENDEKCSLEARPTPEDTAVVGVDLDQGGTKSTGPGKTIRKFDPLKKSKHPSSTASGKKTRRKNQLDEIKKKPDADFEKTLAALGLGSLGLEDSVDDRDLDELDPLDDASSSQMVDMIMRQLLSKDVLYEPMKEIGEKYPEFLSKAYADTESKAEEEQQEHQHALRRYEAQEVYIRKICAVYEAVDWEDRYDELMELLQGMQECGQPPGEVLRELKGDGVGGLFGEDAGGTGDAGDMGGCPVQ